MAATKTGKRVDWEAVERDWRAGLMTKQQMAKIHNVSRAAMDKHFAELGISRDLSIKIRQKAEALVTQKQVTQQVTFDRLVTTEKEIIEVNAQVQADALLNGRKDITRSRVLLMNLLKEVEEQTIDPDMFEQIGELMHSPDEKGMDKLNELYRKVIGTPSRIDSMRKLAETLKTLIGLERQALGLDDTSKPTDDPIREFIQRCSGRSLPIVADEEDE
jgi:hypothetical protein